MNHELEEYFKNMFSNVDSNIVLDKDQIKAIMDENKYALVLAGAGTGKTTTMVGKVKYLVDIKGIDPAKILVISYTKKAVLELQELINDQFNINSTVTTFHSLAYRYVRNIFKDRKCVIVDYNRREKIFYNYINKMFREGKIEGLVDTFNAVTLNDKHFNYGRFFKENYMHYDSYDELFQKYKEKKIKEARILGINAVINEWVDNQINSDEEIFTIRGELVKSVAEAIIANFLYKHGIDYQYEKVYDRIVEDRKVYQPDFTLDLAGIKVYLEYFGLDDEKYNRIKERKIEFHKRYNNKFIFLDNTDIYKIEGKLDYELRKLGFVYHDRSDIEIYNQILDNNKLSQIFKLKKLFFEAIDKIKENPNRSQYYNIVMNYIASLDSSMEEATARMQFMYINDFYIYYSRCLLTIDEYCFDYADLLYYSNKYLYDKRFLENLDYQYIIIDEYQDISDGEYMLSRNTSLRCHAKIFAVGDDWQSIYSFRGSNIDYITNFNYYYKNPKILTIRMTYRNSQELVDIASEFIMRNKSQLRKKLISNKHLHNPIRFVKYNDLLFEDMYDETAEYVKMKEVILNIHKAYPDRSILILARTNRMIDDCFKYDKSFIDDLGTKIKIASIDDLQLDGMTIHKAKGLTYDEVIIIGLNKSYPRDDINNFWLTWLFKMRCDLEKIEFPEERRMLYVALTRTKNHVFVLYNENAKNRSRFADELLEICR